MILLLDQFIDIDEKATLKNMKGAIEKYRRLLFLRPLVSIPSVTASYSFIPPSTAKRLTSIENTVNQLVEREKVMEERNRYMDSFHSAIEQLRPDYRFIIVKKFLQIDRAADVEIYTELCVGKTKYYELKKEALLYLAMYLGIEVHANN